MIGAIAGDIIGSLYEGNNIKSTHFPLFSRGCTFTDDTVPTVAIADSILHKCVYGKKLKEYYTAYPHAGNGGFPRLWAPSDSHHPYYSWGNGSAMRVSPVGFAYETLEKILEEARTHNHPEGIKGAQVTACAAFVAKTEKNKAYIKNFVESNFGYNLNKPIDDIREYYTFDVSCQGSVPWAITAFLESENFEDAIRKAISIGRDSDTIACIALEALHRPSTRKLPDLSARKSLKF